MDDALSSSLEDYLEAIKTLEESHKVARVKDIADLLQVKMPSVTGAIKILKGKGLVIHEKNSYISLTEKGLSISDAISKKHRVLTRFLEQVLLLPSDNAEDTACRIEHSIDTLTANRLSRLVDHIDKMPESEWKKIIGD